MMIPDLALNPGKCKTVEDTSAQKNRNWNWKRADFQVLPLLLIGFATYQLDRTNIASVLTGGFAAAISVDQNTINLGNQLMFLGVIVLEIPSNMVLFRVCYWSALHWYTTRLICLPDWSETVDWHPSVHLWCNCCPTGLCPGQGRVSAHKNNPWPRGSRVYPWCNVYIVNVVYERRADKAHCYILLRYVRWYCCFTAAGSSISQVGWPEWAIWLEVGFSRYFLPCWPC